MSFSKTSASSLSSSSSLLFLSLTRDAMRLISATILGTRTEDACGFGVISIAVFLAGSDIVERVSAKKKTGVFLFIFRLVRESDFWVQNFFVYPFITTFLLYIQLM